MGCSKAQGLGAVESGARSWWLQGLVCGERSGNKGAYVQQSTSMLVRRKETMNRKRMAGEVRKGVREIGRAHV